MDLVITNWIVEHLLIRQRLEEPELYSSIRALRLRNHIPNFNKSLLLNKLESVASQPPLLEGTLFLLEKLDEIEIELGKKASNAMKRAYCAVAVDCTLRPLKHGDDSDAEAKLNLLERVKSVWRGSVKRVEKDEERRGLWSEQLREWKKEIKAAVWETDFRAILLEKFDEAEAEEAVGAYLRDEREKMPPTFLQLLGERVKIDEGLQKLMGVSAIVPEAPSSCAAANGSSGSKEIGTGEIKQRDKHVGVRRLRENCGGTKIFDIDETAQEPHSDSAQVYKAAESLDLSSMEVREVVKDPMPEVSKEVSQDKHQNPAEGVVQSTGGNVSNACKKPSLMERSNCPQTFKWDDETDGSPEDIARGQKRIKASPLKKCDVNRMKKRRKGRRWSLQEEDALVKAVKVHGAGFWKLILNSNREIFEGRTEVDLKDKWRNMNR